MSVRNPFCITKVEAWPIALPLLAPFVVATGQMDVARNIFVRVTLRNGAYGYGEMAPFPDISGEDQEGSLQAFPIAAKECLGQSATQFRKLSQRLGEVASFAPAVRCGIETALLDALCRGMGIPLWGLWGGADVRQRKTDVTLPIGPLDQIVETARAWHARGFRIFKMKVGHEVDEDIRRVEAVYAACPQATFVLDANQGFSLDQARECMGAMEQWHLPVLLFEQPVAREDLEGFVALRRRGTIPIAADESVRSLEDARRLIERRAVDVLNLKITKCGVVESMDIAGLARASGIRLMIGGMVESRVAMGCSWSLVLGLGGFEFLDLDMPLLLSVDPIQGGYGYEGPALQPWEECGLGMEMRQEPSSAIVVE
jgi:L-alanine-DL-glutamate epimerase-like enolase superfamily enzyme